MNGTRRPFAGQAAFLILAAGAIPALIAFCWQSVIATVGDDSVSYLTLARHFAPWRPDALVAPWTAYFSNFPPLFPALLALTGGAHDLFIGHMVVAAGAVASFLLVHRYARERLASEAAALAVTSLFLLLPGMWLGLVGILSESTYLALSLAALVYEARLRADSPSRAYAVLALWFAAALLSRTAGIALIAAYGATLFVGCVRRRSLPAARSWLPVVIPVVAQLAWLWLRPTLATVAYQETMLQLAGLWFQHAATTFAESWHYLSRGWIGVFAADAAGGARAAILFALVAAAALAGAVRAALRNRLDGWYVLASLAMLLFWKFNEDNSRRLLYPLLPLVLLHAAEAVRAVAGSIRSPIGRWVPALAFAFLAAMELPACALILQKATQRDPYYPGLAYSPSSMKEYYGTVNERLAQAAALRDASALGGMSSLEQWTAPGSRVMWVRPEYVALLGRREGVPLFLRWDRPTLAREILRTRTDFVILSRHFKNDLATDTADAFLWLAHDIPGYLDPVVVLPDMARGDFMLLGVDAGRLQRYIRETE